MKIRDGWMNGRAMVWLLVAAGMAAGARADTLINEGFEGLFPGAWTVGDTNFSGLPASWGDVNLAFGGEGAHGGLWKGYCAGTGFGGTTVNPNYQNSMSAYMSRPLDLSQYGSGTLTYWYKIPSIQALNTDKLRVYLGNFLVGEHRAPVAAWTQGAVNLSSFGGSSNPVSLKFLFISDASTVFEGAYLDDIVVNVARPAPDMYETDNSAADAKPIANGENQIRTMHLRGDADWVRFAVGPLGVRNLWMSLRAQSSEDNVINMEMWLYRGNGQLLDHDDGFYGMSGVRVDSVAPGTYYIKIQRTGRVGAVREYSLWTHWDPIYVPDAFEADNAAAAARTIANGEVQNHSIHTPGDIDWMRFSVGAAGVRDLRLVFGPGIPDLFVWLYRGNGEEVAFRAGVDCGVELALTADALASGTYYVKARRSSDLSTLEAYTVRADWTPNSVADAYEPDDTSATAKAIANGQTQNRSIHVAGNVDWARFAVPPAGARNVVVETAGASGDTQMWVYRGSTGAQVAFDDDSGAGDFSRLSVAALTPGTYFIKVQENGNNGAIPAYTLRAGWTSP